jgi:hypothetical protein
VGTRLPQFTDKESQRIMGSYDFIGFNHYSSQYVTTDNSATAGDSHVTVTRKPNTFSPINVIFITTLALAISTFYVLTCLCIS